MSRTELVIRYTAFAGIATLANLLAQRLVLGAVAGTGGFALALVAGTGVGLVVKYLLDKKWIFFDAIQPARAETRKFSLYTATGIGTTLIFWATESAFWLIWQTPAMREAGAILGLSIGYFLKFRLDRRFVFRKSAGRGG